MVREDKKGWVKELWPLRDGHMTPSFNVIQGLANVLWDLIITKNINKIFYIDNPLLVITNIALSLSAGLCKVVVYSGDRPFDGVDASPPLGVGAGVFEGKYFCVFSLPRQVEGVKWHCKYWEKPNRYKTTEQLGTR